MWEALVALLAAVLLAFAWWQGLEKVSFLFEVVFTHPQLVILDSAELEARAQRQM